MLVLSYNQLIFCHVIISVKFELILLLMLDFDLGSNYSFIVFRSLKKHHFIELVRKDLLPSFLNISLFKYITR
uniref:Predicted protein n=1 Tax=Hordeum vulgare subsp. vulgare TaxID=112509 RepID=F2DJ01_HORVV|nr:predicted protein [Hordeum vulgare subsp. vulgare]